MSIPNTLNRIISKEGKVVRFDLGRIARSIAKSILDVTHSSSGQPEARARKYARLVAGRLYRDFYDIHWLKSHFLVTYLSYKPEERRKRLARARVTERLTFLLAQLCRKQCGVLPGKPLARKSVRKFITQEVDTVNLEQRYTEGIIPQFGPAEREDVIEFLTTLTFTMSQAEPLPALLYPHREDVQDTVEITLRDIGEIDIAEAYMIFREGRKKIHSGDISEPQFTNDGIHHVMVGRVLDWNIDWECDSVFALNNWLYARHGKKLPELIAAAEKRYLDDVHEAAARILERKRQVRVIIIAGPSCSNKTTTTVIIGQELKKEGLKLKQLNVDNYFKNLKEQPKDQFGDYDFEMPEAIDIPLLNQHLAGLLAGRTVPVPYYNFKTGFREAGTPFTLAPDELVLIDCLHGHFSGLTAAVPMDQKFSIYIESMNTIRSITGEATRWSDVRMLKRMIRDYKHRGYSPQHTLAHWPYVRKGELKHIIPYILTTDFVINAGLPYELSVLKTALGDLVPGREYVEKLRLQGRLDPYIRGIRVHTLLETVAPFPDLGLIPETSPIREFIGGSSYLIPHND